MISLNWKHARPDRPKTRDLDDLPPRMEGHQKPMTSLLLFIFYDCVTVSFMAGHVLTEEQSEEYYTAVTSDCRRARQSSALDDLISALRKPSRWRTDLSLRRNLKCKRWDCRLRPSWKCPARIIKRKKLLLTDYSESSDGKLNPRGEPAHPPTAS